MTFHGDNTGQTEWSFLLLQQEGILQRLQSSVEQEESRWRVKLELSQGELREVRVLGLARICCEHGFQITAVIERCAFNCILFLSLNLDEPESHISGAGD